MRLDTHIYSGYEVAPYYDPMIGKLIVHGKKREDAIRRMRRALDEMVIEGIHTTIPLYRAIFGNERFRRGGVDTSFIEAMYAGNV